MRRIKYVSFRQNNRGRGSGCGKSQGNGNRGEENKRDYKWRDAAQRIQPNGKKPYSQKPRDFEDDIVVSIFARLEKCKGHIYFLCAAKLLIKSSDRYRFLVVGNGSLEKTLKNTAEEFGISDRVIFTGFVEDVTPYMNITDINVNCSIGTETSSLALSEGMSLGVPAVVSDFGGNPYMIRDGRNGFVFRQKDYRMLAKLISKLAGDKKLYEKMANSARHRFATELNAEKFAKETESLYSSLYKDYLKKSKEKIRRKTLSV